MWLVGNRIPPISINLHIFSLFKSERCGQFVSDWSPIYINLKIISVFMSERCGQFVAECPPSL